ncbi:meckelin-like [Conger conger]|uniref:meckelin-like n=1 Tax=Conger conger TaxID=82655 RepID=UPI002A5A73F5|nr:meckelin-like [Conger conger]
MPPPGLKLLSGTQMNLKVVKFNARGRFLGWEDVLGGSLQLCPDTQQRLDAAYDSGTTYQQSCSIPVAELLSRYPEPVFYQLFLKHQDGEGLDMVWPIPVQHLSQVTGPDRSMALRRFFLVDGLTGRDSSMTQQPQTVRYLSRLLLRVNIPTMGPGGTPPFQLLVEYNTVTDPANAVAQVSFGVTYSLSEEATQRDTAISLGVLAILSLLFAMLETSSWSRRAGQQYITLTTIVKFLAFLIGNLANAFFLVSFGTGVYWLIAFKGQRSSVNMVLPSAGGTVETHFIVFLSLAFAFKAVQVMHLLITQVSISIFLIDWEKPRNAAGASGSGVSAWRTFFVANEWNEIQTARKLNPLLQLLTVLLILQVVGVENIASRDLKLASQPDGARYIPPTSPILRYGLTVSVWLSVGLVQVIFYLVVYERLVEDKFRQFVDLCSMSNVSVFVLAHRCYGYYIHGRSVHGHADVSMEAMRANLRREEANLCALRGLEPSADVQTFEIALTAGVRQQLDRVSLSLAEASGARGRHSGADGPQGPQEQTSKAYHAMNYFLSSFLEHAHKDMDYFVKDKLFLERITKYEFQQPVERTIFYRDPDGISFTNVLYFSNELTLLLFDTLLFCVIDLGSQDLVLAAVLTYAVQQVLHSLRCSLSRRNVSEKTLVDRCFLI